MSSRVFYSAVSTAPRFLFFFVLSVTRRRPPLGQFLVGTLNHENCHVYSPKAFETLIHEHVTHIVFFVVCKIYIPEFLKTGLVKIRAHFTTWQLKAIKSVQRPIKKPISDAEQ